MTRGTNQLVSPVADARVFHNGPKWRLVCLECNTREDFKTSREALNEMRRHNALHAQGDIAE